MPRIATLATTPFLFNPNLAPPYPQLGQVIYDIPGTYSWVCPAGVTSVSVVAIGGGGGGGVGYTTYSYNSPNATYYYYKNYVCSGGGGGGLGYRNNITVVPGQSYTVVVGKGGFASLSNWGHTSGENSYFISTSTVRGGGGGAGTSLFVSYGSNPNDISGGSGGTWFGNGGGNGGAGGDILSVGLSAYVGGGGGAGGYGSNGGKGGGYSSSTSTRDGVNGVRSGAGGAADLGQTRDKFDDSRVLGGYGGGVGLLGHSSAASIFTTGGDYDNPVSSTKGNDGDNYNDYAGQSSDINGVGYTSPNTIYGGGGGGLITRYGASDLTLLENATSHSGAVKIIWPGTERTFPSTRMADESTVATI